MRKPCREGGTWGPLQGGGALKMPVAMLGGLKDAGGELEDGLVGSFRARGWRVRKASSWPW